MCMHAIAIKHDGAARGLHRSKMLLKCVCLGLALFALASAAYNEDEEEQQEYLLGRYKRQAEDANETEVDDGPRPVPPNMRQCCKKMPRVIPMRMFRGCRGPPPHGGPPPPGGPPPHGRPPPPGGPPPPEGDIDEGIPEPPSDDEEGDDDSEGPVTDGAATAGEDGAPQKYKGQGGRGKKCKGGGRDGGASKEKLACSMECAFNKSGMIKDGVVDQDAFKADMEKMKEEKNGDVWKDAIDAALQNCSSTVPSAVKQDQKCKSGALEMAVCMDNLLFMNCPDSLWKSDNEKCKACRESPENCAQPKREKKKKKNKNKKKDD